MLRMNAVEGRTATRHFLDTNVLLYMICEDHAKADVAEDLLEGGGTVSVQVLDEFASVAIRKLGLQFSEVQELLAGVRLPRRAVDHRHPRVGIGILQPLWLLGIRP